MNTILTRPITIEEFEAFPYAETERMELVRGVLKPKDPIDDRGLPMSPGAEHGDIQGLIYLVLKTWAQKGKSGYVGVEAGYVLDRIAKTVRYPDVSFLSNSARPAGRIPEGAWSVPPDLAVEVISPSERANDVREKVSDYLDAGARMVWTVWPRPKEVVVHTPDGQTHTYGEADTLAFPDLLPGFSCTVADFFAQDIDE